jgi:UDP-N-acetylmuramyl pentapeptide phosphotransferase/UDP-N-acetylglucosamine-1-phosphate transferase
MLVHFANIRITSFFGIFGIHELDIITSYVFSVFTMVVITNAMNLIDGIDCLAGAVGTLAALVLGFWFYTTDHTQYSILAGCLAGSLIAFLYYNRTPARIFMGDTGSLIVGIVLSILAIKFIEMNRILPVDDPSKIRRVPVFAIAVLIIPLFDTLRVFMIRMLQGRSPFHPDRNHIHHLLIDLGMSHIKATSALIGFNILAIVFAYFMQSVRSEIILTLILTVCMGLTSILASLRNKKNKLKIISVATSAAIKKTP